MHEHPILSALVFFWVPGIYALADALKWQVLIIVGVAVALGLLALVSQYVRALSLVLGTNALPWIALLGINVYLGLVGIHIRQLELGLAIGLVVFCAVAVGLLTLWQEHLLAAIGVGLVLAALNVAGLPYLLGSREAERSVVTAQPLRSQLDAVIVVPGRSDEPVARGAAATEYPGWQVRYAVARATGDRAPRADWLTLGTDDPAVARLAALGAGPPLPGSPPRRPEADRVVLLNVDGTAPVTERPWALPDVDATDGEVGRWLAIADTIAGHEDSVVALLQTHDHDRLKRWQRELAKRGGFAVSAQELRARSITDAALRVAVESPSASEHLALAVRFRPVLLLSKGLERDVPLDVDAMFASGRIGLCHDDNLAARSTAQKACPKLTSAAGLVNGRTHLQLPPSGTWGDMPTRVYAHPVEATERGRKLLYLDYWWYFDANPNKVGKGGFCGAGLALPGLSCFEHESDWEGVTVIVDRSGSEPVPVAVQYAQHSAVVRYSFADLLAQRRGRNGLGTSIRDVLADAGIDRDVIAERPLVFVAGGSHASYPAPCAVRCAQGTEVFGEDGFDGRADPTWRGNDPNRCIAESCVRLTPTRERGAEPALWNAYDGVWGSRRCILRAYCTAEAAPAAPGTQGRYRHPQRITAYAGARSKPKHCSQDETKQQPCPSLPPAPAAGAAAP